jgi:hypothetical protein
LKTDVRGTAWGTSSVSEIVQGADMGIASLASKRLGRRACAVVAMVAAIAVPGVGLSPAASATAGDLHQDVWTWVTDEPLGFDGDGWPIMSTPRPQFVAGECSDSGEVGAGIVYGLRLEGADGDLVEAIAQEPVFTQYDDGWVCAEALWTPETDLHVDTYYEVSVRAVAPDGATWDWVWSMRLFVAGPLAAPTPTSPAVGSTVDANQPVLAADWQSPLWDRFELHFVLQSANGLVLEGSAPGSEDGVVEWTVPQVLAAGQYSWSVRVAAVEGELTSDWSPESTFAVSSPAIPDPVSPADGAGVLDPVGLTAQVTTGGRADVRGVFKVTRADSGEVVAEGASDWAHADGRVTWTVPSGLSRGEYRWRVATSDGASLSDWSSERSFVIASPPDQPQVYGFESTRDGAVLRWYRAGDSPDSPVLDYTITAEPGGYSRTIPADDRMRYTEALAGLPGGLSYTFKVSARNRWGTSTSIGRQAYIAHQTPLAPQNVRTQVEGTTLTVAWDPPTDTGGESITGYWVKEFPAAIEHELGADQTSFVFQNVAPGTWYSLTIRARTRWGLGAQGSAGYLPYTIPGAPTDVATRLGDRKLEVSWAAPASDGWSPITGYRVTAAPGGMQVTVGPDTHATIPGLQNETEYTFTVVAINAAGQGPASEPSAPRAPISQVLDSDGDGLPDIVEERAGSSPQLTDSDFDGLDDGIEVRELWGLTSPTAPDSDANGIGDADDDADGDGLSNLGEVQAGTSPTAADSDGDGLSDSEEAIAGTDPMVADSDNDGLKDGDEAASGTDPAIADTDGDGAPDAQSEAVRQLAHGGVRTSVTGPAGAVLGASVATADSNVPGAVTPAATVTVPAQAAMDTSESGQAVTTTDLTFDLADRQPVAGRQFVAMAWDGAESTWQRVPTTVTVSPTSHTVTIDSPTLGVSYTIVDLSEWQARARTCDLAATGNAPLDVDVILDARPGVVGTDPTGEGLQAASAMLATLSPGDDARLHVVQTVIDQYGGGGISIRGEITDGPDVPDGGTSVTQVQEQLDEVLATGWTLDGWYEGINELDWLNGGFGERAFGQQDPWPDTRDGVCRGQALVLVTDGLLVPDDPWDTGGPDYVPFVERTSPPVHVLDVGTGDAQWLKDIAAQTGGSYTHVPTESAEGGWVRSSLFPLPGPDVFTADDDGDGLSNWLEEFGVRSANAMSSDLRAKFTSDPQNPDTDGDGIWDGDEVGEPLTPAAMGGWASNLPITTYRVRSDPGRPDGDLDGLDDTDELENELDPLNPDMDRDGLPDGDEALWGTSPTLPDTDADQWVDGVEVNLLSEGFDPLEINLPVDKNTWLHDFMLGAFCGDIEYCRQPTLAWLMGDLASGVAIYGDVRDWVESIYEGGNLNTAIIPIGLIPYFGDGVVAAAKVVRILPDLAGAEARAARRILRQVDDTGEFIEHMRTVYGDIVDRLKALGADEDDLARLLDSNDPNDLTRMVDSTLRVAADAPGPEGPARFFFSGADGEQFMRSQLGLDPLVREQALWIGGSTRPAACRGCRVPDGVVRERIGGLEHLDLHEAKVGLVRSPFAWRQFQKDIALVQAGEARSIVWHFYASDWTGKIGPSRGFLSKIEALATQSGVDVTFVLHLPAGG